jgi:hypothetical protein
LIGLLVVLLLLGLLVLVPPLLGFLLLFGLAVLALVLMPGIMFLEMPVPNKPPYFIGIMLLGMQKLVLLGRPLGILQMMPRMNDPVKLLIEIIPLQLLI